MESSRAVQAQKALLRKELYRKRRVLGPTERRQQSETVLARLVEHPRFIRARAILTYLSTAQEVETRPFVEEALRSGKKVYLPRVTDREGKEIAAIEVTSLRGLSSGSYGILEPPLDPERRGRPEELDLVVVPGVGFDRTGGRLGRGEGYFDRFLKKAKRAYKIGLAYDCQMVDKVPGEAHDVRVDEVLIG